jgi:DNA-binding response OmpR family regulator
VSPITHGSEAEEQPIIVLTATHDLNLNVKGFQAGGTLAMRKPIQPTQLVTAIQIVLALAAKRRSG